MHLLQKVQSTKYQVSLTFVQGHKDWPFTLIYIVLSLYHLCELDRHSKYIHYQSETLYKQFNGDVKFGFEMKVKVKLNFVSLKLPVTAFLG